MAGRLAEADAGFRTQLQAAQEAAAADRATAEAEQDMLRRMVELKVGFAHHSPPDSGCLARCVQRKIL